MHVELPFVAGDLSHVDSTSILNVQPEVAAHCMGFTSQPLLPHGRSAGDDANVQVANLWKAAEPEQEEDYPPETARVLILLNE